MRALASSSVTAKCTTLILFTKELYIRFGAVDNWITNHLYSVQNLLIIDGKWWIKWLAKSDNFKKKKKKSPKKEKKKKKICVPKVIQQCNAWLKIVIECILWVKALIHYVINQTLILLIIFTLPYVCVYQLLFIPCYSMRHFLWMSFSTELYYPWWIKITP